MPDYYLNDIEIEKLHKKMVEKLNWGKFATFGPNKNLPIHRWFYFKEGFSRDLVFDLLNTFDASNKFVFDPFCGSGTTLLTCKEMDISGAGYDVLPISVFASQVKTANYDIEQLKSEAKILLKKKISNCTSTFIEPIMQRAFSKYVLEDISFYMKEIENLQYRDFFTLALINASVKCSWAQKDGILKIRKRDNIPLKVIMRKTVYGMINDLKKVKMYPADISVYQHDARDMHLKDESVDVMITSPPYLNQIDYKRVYEIENTIVGATNSVLKDDMNCINTSDIQSYFQDMSNVIKDMYRICNKGAKIAILVGNAYMEKIIESDLILASQSKETGFSLNKIYVVNKRFALKNRTKKCGILRESLLILEKS